MGGGGALVGWDGIGWDVVRMGCDGMCSGWDVIGSGWDVVGCAQGGMW